MTMTDVRPDLRCEPGDSYIANPDSLSPTRWTRCTHPECNRVWWTDAPPTKYVCARFPDQAAAQFRQNLKRRDELDARR